MSESVTALKEQLDGRVDVTEDAAKSTAAMLHPPSKTDNPGFPDANNTASIRSNCDVNYSVIPPSILTKPGQSESNGKWNASIYQNPNNLECPIGIWCWVDGYEHTFGQLTYPPGYDSDNGETKFIAVQSYPLWGKDMYCVKQASTDIGVSGGSLVSTAIGVSLTQGSSAEIPMPVVGGIQHSETHSTVKTYAGDAPVSATSTTGTKAAHGAGPVYGATGAPSLISSVTYQEGGKGLAWYDQLYFNEQTDEIKDSVVAYVRYVQDPFIPSFGSASNWRCIAASNTVYMECAELYKQGMVYGGQAAPPTKGLRQFSYNASSRGYPENIRNPTTLNANAVHEINMIGRHCYSLDFERCYPTETRCKLAGKPFNSLRLEFDSQSKVTFDNFQNYADGEFSIKSQNVFNTILISYDIHNDSLSNAKTLKSIMDSNGENIAANMHLQVTDPTNAYSNYKIHPNLVGNGFTYSGGSVKITNQSGEMLVLDSASLTDISISSLSSRITSGDYTNWDGVDLVAHLNNVKTASIHYQTFNDFITHGDIAATVLMVTTDEFSVPSLDLYRGCITGACNVTDTSFKEISLTPFLRLHHEDTQHIFFATDVLTGADDGALYRPKDSISLASSTSFVPTDRNAIQTMSQLMQHEAKHGSFQVARLYDANNPYVAALDYSNLGTAISTQYEDANSWCEWYFMRGSRADEAVVWNSQKLGIYTPYPFGYCSRIGCGATPKEYSRSMNDWQEAKEFGGAGVAHYNKAQVTHSWGSPVALYQGMLSQAVLKGRGSRDLEITPIVGSQLAALISEPARPDQIAIDAAVTYLNKTPVLMRARDNDVGSWLNTLTQIGKVAAPMLTALHPAAGMIATAAMSGLDHANNTYQKNLQKDLNRVKEQSNQAMANSTTALNNFNPNVRSVALPRRGPVSPTAINPAQGGAPGLSQQAAERRRAKNLEKRERKKNNQFTSLTSEAVNRQLKQQMTPQPTAPTPLPRRANYVRKAKKADW